MEDIDFVHTPDGFVKVYTTTEPYMEVVATSYELGKHIIEKNKLWLEERLEQRRVAEMKRALEEIEVVKIKEDEPPVDTAPSEWVNPEHYMDQDIRGC